MSEPGKEDRDLDAYLSGDSPLSRAYQEDARELPPAHLDAQILAEAHRADAGVRTSPARSPFSSSWMAPASLAAVVVLAASLAVLLPEGRPGLERERELPADAADQRLQSEPAPATGYAPPPPAAESAEPSTGAAPPAPKLMQRAEEALPEAALKSVPQRESETAAPASPPGSEAAPAGDALRQRPAARGDVGASTVEDRAVMEKAETEADAWLQRIEQMIARGDLEAARRSLAELRAVHPGVQVPQRIVEALGGG